MREIFRINAILDTDLEKILESKDLLKTIQQGQAKCFICGELISISNISAIHFIEGEVKLCCDNEKCSNFK